jgi:hypothetical protein
MTGSYSWPQTRATAACDLVDVEWHRLDITDPMPLARPADRNPPSRRASGG